ncbi:hypothetical protein VB715_09115 [Crocosphaera sp. UHCC 0190]|uniref:hypothetical protein n=1 Tax=Crocosphaera sp. UHCC 0190 TaxID=3110246 RepID=UPI002B2035EE|nr:hypothetical protein [Crocosphaera sp. UHCC 0190]MEA5509923.1 hypothetical protein [Crocosphaera sp. UHCC 0190]
MNTDTFFQLLQQSFHIGVGATAALLETLQDPQKRSETLSILQTQMSEKTQEWAEKGEITEQEARRLLDQWLNQSNRPSNPSQSSSSSISTKGNVDSEIQQLTEQVMALRRELEELRQK